MLFRSLFGDFKGETIDGVQLNKDAALAPEQIAGFVDRYAGALEDKAVAKLYRDALAKLQDEAAPLEVIDFDDIEDCEACKL